MKKILLPLVIVPLFLLIASPVSASVLYNETFSGTNGTTLQDHETHWAPNPGNPDIILNGDNTASTGDIDTHYWWNSTKSPYEDVEYDFKVNRLAGANYYAMFFRESGGGGGDANDGIYIKIFSDYSGELINQNNAVTHTFPVGYFTEGQWYTFRGVYQDDDTIAAYLDGDLIEEWESMSTSQSTGSFSIQMKNGIIRNLSYSDSPTKTIGASPSSANVTVGAPFLVNVMVNDSGQVFNAARATITVSSNLTINSIATPTSGSCNLNYTQTPTTNDLSFAGAIYGSSSTTCKVYTVTLTPNAEGAGTITFSNASIKAYADNSEISTGVTNASFTIGNGPTPTQTPLLEFQVTSPYETYKENFTITGTKLDSITAMFLNGSDDDSVYPTSTSWEIPVTLSLGDNNYTLYGSDGTNHTATQNLIIDRHILGDINGDGEIDLIDASLFAVDWDKTEGLTYVLSDMNDDGVVDLTDLSILAKLEQ